jgi:hypothetical protein
VVKPPLARTPDAQSGVPVRDVETRAAQAFEDGDHATSESLYAGLLQRGGLAPEAEAEAWQRLADRALAQGHLDTARQALDSLVRLDARALDSWDYNRATIDLLLRSGKPDQARAHLESLLHDPARPWDLRLRAGLSVARDLWSERRYEQAMRILERLYADSPEPSPLPRGQLEAGLLAELQDLDDAILADLVRLTPVESQWNFPYTIVRLEQARRLGLQEKNWPTAWHILSGISRKGEVADRTLVGGVLTPLRSRFGLPSGGVALALPLSGPFAEIGWKVLRGAGAAQWNILSQGGQMSVQVLNTDAPGWLDEVAALPADCTLRAELNWQRCTNGGEPSARRPVLYCPGGRRGSRDAWRFLQVEDQAGPVGLPPNPGHTQTCGLAPRQALSHATPVVAEAAPGGKSRPGSYPATTPPLSASGSLALYSAPDNAARPAASHLFRRSDGPGRVCAAIFFYTKTVCSGRPCGPGPGETG